MALKVIITITLLGIFIAYQLVDQFDPEMVSGKNVVITGASTGIGEQLAYHYARLGANIVITARREQQLQQVIEKCRKIGKNDGKYYYVPLDMADEEAPLKLVSYAESVLTGIDHVILNHATYKLGDWQGKENLTTLRNTFMVNFDAYVSIASHVMHHLESSKGSIIVMSSVSSMVPMPFITTYTASKHAIQVSGPNCL